MKTKKEKGCTCEIYDPKQPHEYTCELNINQAIRRATEEKSAATHTPTPTLKLFHGDYDGRQVFGDESKKILVAEFVSEDHAAFIVRAVNSQEALLEELVDQKSYMEQQVFVPGFSNDQRAPIAQKRYLSLCKAIALAEGRNDKGGK